MVFSIFSEYLGRWHFLERRKSKYVQVPLRRKIFGKKQKFNRGEIWFSKLKIYWFGKEIACISFPNQWILSLENQISPRLNFCFFPNLFRRKGTCPYFDFRRSRKCHRPKYSLHVEKTIKIVNYHLFFGQQFIIIRYLKPCAKKSYHLANCKKFCSNFTFWKLNFSMK